MSKWEYKPLDADFWDEFQAKVKNQKWDDALTLAREQIGKTKGLEKVEGQMAEILIMAEKGQSVLAYHRALALLETAPGSMPALRTWILVEQMAQAQNLDLLDLQRLANIGNFKEAPESIIPLLDYLVVLANKNNGNGKWSRASETRLDPESYWGVFYDVQKFVLNMPKVPTEETLEAWRKLSQRAQPYPTLREKMSLQEARFLQSLNEPAKALEIYNSLRPTGREFGRQLFEKSWALYNLKQYSSSLGFLQTLKTSSMRMSIEPEVYILSMIAYRDLCHYPAVRIMREQFLKVFGSTLDQIKNGEPFENILILQHLVAQVDPWSNLANEITRLKVERSELKTTFKILDKDQIEKMDLEAWGLEKKLVARLQRRSLPEMRRQAERLVMLTEQVKLLEYVSDVQEYKLNMSQDDLSYRSEQAKATGTEGLFWKVDGEDWEDEFGTYKVLVSDRCPSKKERR